MGSGQITKNLINVDPIKIIQFCLKIMICRDTPPIVGYVGGWMGQLLNGWGQVK